MPTSADSTINLLKSAISPGISPDWEKKIQKVSYWCLGSVISLGLILGIAFLVLRGEQAGLANETTKVNLESQAQAQKEVYLAMLKNRLSLAGKALSSGNDWGSKLSSLKQIAEPPELKSVNVDEAGLITLALETASLEKASSIAGQLITLSEDKQIRQLQLSSLMLARDGKVQLNFSFLPVF